MMAEMAAAIEADRTKWFRDLAREVYLLHGNITAVAARDYFDRVAVAGKLDDLALWASFEFLDAQRLLANKRVYEQSYKLRARLTVQSPPEGFKAPNEPATTTHATSSLRGGVGRGGMAVVSTTSIASMRALLELKLRVSGKLFNASAATQPEFFRVADQLEQQGEGCLKNSRSVRDFGRQMLPGERGLDTVRRLEQGA